MITSLKIFFSLLLAWMIWVVVSTSLENNLFEQWNFLGSIPWMRATLWDFYANVAVIAGWVLYKERSAFMKVNWIILLVTLGSIATCAYVLIQLFRLKPGQGLRELFAERND